jgi:hypothetical protein
MIRTTKAKTIAAAVGTFCTLAVTAFADDVLDVSEAGGLIAGAITAVAAIYAVFQTPNKPVQ